jgi:hypothetical protein
MTIKEKIITGVLVRATVNRNLSIFQARYEEAHKHWITLQGFERDRYASTVLAPLDADINLGLKILKIMDEVA